MGGGGGVSLHQTVLLEMNTCSYSRLSIRETCVLCISTFLLRVCFWKRKRPSCAVWAAGTVWRAEELPATITSSDTVEEIPRR